MKGHDASALRRAAMSVVCASALSTGCLSDAPEYPPRTQIPPFIVSAQITPSPAEVYQDGAPIDVNVPFRSEDENEDLSALFFVDLVPGEPSSLFEQSLPIEASTYDDTSRAVRYTWNNRLGLRGCHSLTLLLTYDYNLAGTQPLDETLVASVVWWMLLDDPQGTVLVSNCPRAS